MRLLLVSATGSPYFEHCREDLVAFLGSATTVGFVSAANLFNETDSFRRISERLTETPPRMVRTLRHLRWDSDAMAGLHEVDAVLVGGGNTYALLQRLSESRLLEALRDKVRRGLPYIGSSAGANIAGPNILTTNDWNVVGSSYFQSLGWVPFNINPHYIERSAWDAPHSETRDQRIREYHRVWSNPVVGIEENAVLRVLDDRVAVVGRGRAKLFLPNDTRRWFSAGEDLTFDGVDGAQQPGVALPIEERGTVGRG